MDDILEIVRKKWKWEKNIIDKANIIDWRPHGLRWLIRNGEKVLQQELLVKIYFTEVVWKHGEWTYDDKDYVWFDVLTENEE